MSAEQCQHGRVLGVWLLITRLLFSGGWVSGEGDLGTQHAGNMASVLCELSLRRGRLGNTACFCACAAAHANNQSTRRAVNAEGPRQTPREVLGESPMCCHAVLVAESPTNQT